MLQIIYILSYFSSKLSDALCSTEDRVQVFNLWAPMLKKDIDLDKVMEELFIMHLAEKYYSDLPLAYARNFPEVRKEVLKDGESARDFEAAQIW